MASDITSVTSRMSARQAKQPIYGGVRTCPSLGVIPPWSPELPSSDELFAQITQRLPAHETFTLRRLNPNDWEARTFHGAVGYGHSQQEALAQLRDRLDEVQRPEVRNSLAGTKLQNAKQIRQPWDVQPAKQAA